MKISLIIPVLNGEKTLDECLSSVTEQDYDNYEIIVVDNGSTDKTRDIVETFSKKYSNIKYIFESRKGRGSARNAGINKAVGEIIAMTDVDCSVPHNWLRSLTSLILSGEEQVTLGFEIDAVNNYWSSVRQKYDWIGCNVSVKNGYANHLDTKNFAIKSELMKKMMFDSQLAALEDWDLLVRLKLAAIPIRFLDDVLVSHYHDSSLWELTHTQFVRGYWAAVIRKKYYRNDIFRELFKNDSSVKPFLIRNFLTFIPWAVWQFLWQPREAPYIVCADLSWKIGVLSFWVKNIFLPFSQSKS